ncbi:MAG: HPr family phosphocarrier protein [Candidatus Brocadiia bacterium]
MIVSEITVTHRYGLHARPSQRLASLASRFACSIEVEYGKDRVDAKSVLNLISLGVQRSSSLKFFFNGADEVAAESQIIDLVRRNFDLDED